MPATELPRRTPRPRTLAYWGSTILVSLALLSAGVAYLLGAEVNAQGLLALGYPTYVLTLLGFWKLFGGLALLAPRLALVKEWAYAGIGFNLSGAAFSHLAVGDASGHVIAPLVLLGLAAISWALRPCSRRLATAGTVVLDP